MKQKIAVILLFLIFKTGLGYGQIDQLMKINYNSYVGKTVNSLVTVLPAGIDSMRVISQHKGYGSKLCVYYPNKVRLTIKAAKFQYMDPRPFKANGTINTWDVNLFLKETIAFSILYDSGGCEMGCSNECQGCPEAP